MSGPSDYAEQVRILTESLRGSTQNILEELQSRDANGTPQPTQTTLVWFSIAPTGSTMGQVRILAASAVQGVESVSTRLIELGGSITMSIWWLFPVTIENVDIRKIVLGENAVYYKCTLQCSFPETPLYDGRYVMILDSGMQVVASINDILSLREEFVRPQ